VSTTALKQRHLIQASDRDLQHLGAYLDFPLCGLHLARSSAFGGTTSNARFKVSCVLNR
jgi:hypothetical protein